jgi:hypothetical protein
MVDGLHPIDPGTAALNTDFTAGEDITVELEAWVLLGGQTRRDATGALFLYSSENTPKLPADVALQRTILESSGSEPRLEALHLGRGMVAGRAAETASVSTSRGDYGAWTFTTGATRFILDTRQQPHTGALDLTRRAPGLLTAGTCADS